MESIGKLHEDQIFNQYIHSSKHAMPFLIVPAYRVQGQPAPRIQLSQLALQFLDTLRDIHEFIYIDQGPGIPCFHSRALHALQNCRCQIQSPIRLPPLTVSLPRLADILTHKCQSPVHSHLSQSLSRPSKYKDCEPQPRYECMYLRIHDIEILS